jgi:hypothetical protein
MVGKLAALKVEKRAAKLAGCSAAYLVDELADSWAAKMVDSKALPFA